MSTFALQLPRSGLLEQGVGVYLSLAPLLSENSTLSLCEEMKRAIVISTILVSAIALISCTTATTPNQFGQFLDGEALRVRTFQAETNDTGYQAAIELIGVADTNRVIEGWMMLEDVGMRQANFARSDDERRERERKEREQIATDTNLHLRVMCDRGDWGWITHARALDSDRIKERFPCYKIFSVGCIGASLNPVFIAQPLVIGTNYSDAAMSSVFVLGNAPTVASFMTDHRKPVHTQGEARATLDLLCELQSWTICERMPDEVSGWKDAEDPEWVSRWTYRVTESKDGWAFQAVFLTDPQIRSYSHYKIEILHDGTITVKNRVYMGSAGGYL